MQVTEALLKEIADFTKEKTERDIIFMYVQGSQNYNLDTEASDIDCKAFVVPTFGDLYYGDRYSTTIDTPYGQVTIHDIRMLPELLLKMNATYIELLFSKYVYYPSEEKKQELLEEVPLLSDFPKLFNMLFRCRKYRFIEALCGTFKTKRKEVNHPSAIRVPVVEKYGYDIKSASHAVRYFRLLTLAISMATHASGRSSYEKYLAELRLDDERARPFLLSIKEGRVSKNDIMELLNHELDYVNWANKEFDELCKSESDAELRREFNNSIYRYIRKQF